LLNIEIDQLPNDISLSIGSQKDSVAYEEALENLRKNSDWWVVFSIFDIPNFDPSPLSISAKTGLSVENVVEALEGLATLGYLEKDKGRFIPIRGKDFFKLDFTKRQKAELIDEHTVVSQQILNHLTEDALVAIDHRCFASNSAVLQELYNDISVALEKAFTNSSKSKTKDRIFKMTFTAADVLSTKGATK